MVPVEPDPILTRPRGPRTLLRFLGWMIRAEPGRAIAALGLDLAVGVLPAAMVWVVRELFDRGLGVYEGQLPVNAMLPWLALWAAVIVAETGIQTWTRLILLERVKQELEDRLLEQLQVKSRALHLETFERADFHDLLRRAQEAAKPGFFLNLFGEIRSIHYRNRDGGLRRRRCRTLEPGTPRRRCAGLAAASSDEHDSRPRPVLHVSTGHAGAAAARLPGKDADGAGRRQGGAGVRPGPRPDRLVGVPLLASCRCHLSTASQKLGPSKFPFGVQSPGVRRRRWMVGLGGPRGWAVGGTVRCYDCGPAPGAPERRPGHRPAWIPWHPAVEHRRPVHLPGFEPGRAAPRSRHCIAQEKNDRNQGPFLPLSPGRASRSQGSHLNHPTR